MLRLDGAGAVVRFTFEGRAVDAREGDSVATALVAAGIGPVRFSAVSGEPRAPYCMMGICFECLVEIDGCANRQACMVRVRPGMQVMRGRAPDA
jgi:D-hydroxyproline dehydrogenase subunit gamma